MGSLLNLNCFVEYVDHPLEQVRNRDVESNVVFLPNLADTLIIFFAQRDLLKVPDDAVLLYRFGDHGVAPGHPMQ